MDMFYLDYKTYVEGCALFRWRIIQEMDMFYLDMVNHYLNAQTYRILFFLLDKFNN